MAKQSLFKIHISRGITNKIGNTGLRKHLDLVVLRNFLIFMNMPIKPSRTPAPNPQVSKKESIEFPTVHMGSVGHLWKGHQTTNKIRVKPGNVPCYARFYLCAIPQALNPGGSLFLTAYSLKRREFSQSPYELPWQA